MSVNILQTHTQMFSERNISDVYVNKSICRAVGSIKQGKFTVRQAKNHGMK